jgi:hypothetical protein
METLYLRLARPRSIPIEQTRWLEREEMSATSKSNPRKVVFADRSGKPTHFFVGKADDMGEETGKSTPWNRRGRGPGNRGRIRRDIVGNIPLVAGVDSNLRRLLERGLGRRRGEPEGMGA